MLPVQTPSPFISTYRRAQSRSKCPLGYSLPPSEVQYRQQGQSRWDRFRTLGQAYAGTKDWQAHPEWKNMEDSTRSVEGYIKNGFLVGLSLSHHSQGTCPCTPENGENDGAKPL